MVLSVCMVLWAVTSVVIAIKPAVLHVKKKTKNSPVYLAELCMEPLMLCTFISVLVLALLSSL